MEEDDDDFLYGTSNVAPSEASVSQPKPVENSLLDSSGIVSQLEAVAADAAKHLASMAQTAVEPLKSEEPPDEGDPDEGDEDGDESDDEDIEIIMEPTARSLDFRQQRGPQQQQQHQQQRTPSAAAQPRAPQPSLTTEYTPIQRLESTSSLAGVSNSLNQLPSSTSLPSISQPPVQPSSTNNLNVSLDNGVDPSTLPPVKAPSSHPEIDPTVTGILDGRAIYEVDIAAMSDKPWRRPGSDISDWFNYGFDEISWEAYCYRRREFGEMADALKVNVLNFSAMPEDQVAALPSELRQMVMTGATAAMMNNTPNPGMMNPGVMMDMGMMNSMGMGMNGDMSMNQQMMPVDQRGMMMQDGVPQQGPMGNTGTQEQGGGVGMMQDGFTPTAPMAMSMPGDFSMQEQQPMYPGAGMEGQVPQSVTPSGPSSRGGPVPSYRGRGNMAPGMRGRGFPVRGRGRGGMYVSESAPPVVARPASPLPPNVPTGPRNQNKYKDRDGNAPAVDGLDYGDRVGGSHTPSGDTDERSGRKRRVSPGLDDSRGSKRR